MVFAKNAELTPVLAQGDSVAYRPFRNLYAFVTGTLITQSRSVAIKVDIQNRSPSCRAFGHRGFTHSLLAVFALLGNLLVRFLKAGSFRLMRYKEWCWVI